MKYVALSIIYLSLLPFTNGFCQKDSLNSNKKVLRFFKDKEDYHNEILVDFDFNDRFELFYNDHSCVVIDLNSDKEIYSNKNFTYPFNNNDNSYHIFNAFPLNDVKFLCSDGEYLWQPEYDYCRVAIQDAFYSESDPNLFRDYVYSDTIPNDAVTIDNSLYFFNLGKNHSENPDSRCCLVAIQILAGYYDTFYNDDYVPEEWDRVSTDNVSNVYNWENWEESPGTGKMETPKDQRILEYLTEYTENNVNSNVTSSGLSFYQQKSVLDYYLFEQCISYTLSYCEGNLNDYWTQYNKAKIKEGINNNYPVIVNGAHHSTVAFGYDDDYVYVHNGWGNCSRVPWSIYTGWEIIYPPSSMYLIPSQNHSHSNNYYSTHFRHFYCSCGEEWDDFITAFPILPIASSPNTTPEYFYHYYTPEHIAAFCYKGVYKNSNNELVMTRDSTLTISFYHGNHLRGISLNGIFDSSFSLFQVMFSIDFLDSYDCVIYSYNAKKYSDLYNLLNINDLSLNCQSYTTQVRIRVSKSVLPPLQSAFTISKLTLSII